MVHLGRLKKVGRVDVGQREPIQVIVSEPCRRAQAGSGVRAEEGGVGAVTNHHIVHTAPGTVHRVESVRGWLAQPQQKRIFRQWLLHDLIGSLLF